MRLLKSHSFPLRLSIWRLNYREYAHTWKCPPIFTQLHSEMSPSLWQHMTDCWHSYIYTLRWTKFLLSCTSWKAIFLAIKSMKNYWPPWITQNEFIEIDDKKYTAFLGPRAFVCNFNYQIVVLIYSGPKKRILGIYTLLFKCLRSVIFVMCLKGVSYARQGCIHLI